MPLEPTKPKENSTPIKIESSSGAMPEALKDTNFTTEQLPSLSEDEGRPAAIEEVKGEGKTTIPVKKLEEIEKPKEEKSTEEKEEVKSVEEKEEGVERFLKPPKGSEAEKKAQEKKGSKDTFDYSGYADDEVSILKNMPVGNRERVGKLFKENKELSKVKENQFFQSPEGYLLDPRYRAEVNTIQQAEREAQIWSKALKDIKAGIAIKPLEGWRDGQPVYGAEIKATDDIEESVRNNFNECLKIANERKGIVSNYVKNFSQLATRDMGLIKAERAKRFAWVANPKLLDHSIETVDGDKTIRQVRSDISSLFPAYMRNNEAVEACGDLMVALMIARAELNEAKKGVKVKEIKKEEESLLEPTGDIRPKKTTEPVHGVKTFTTEGAGIEI